MIFKESRGDVFYKSSQKDFETFPARGARQWGWREAARSTPLFPLPYPLSEN
jgi:hypothetical protein